MAQEEDPVTAADIERAMIDSSAHDAARTNRRRVVAAVVAAAALVALAASALAPTLGEEEPARREAAPREQPRAIPSPHGKAKRPRARRPPRVEAEEPVPGQRQRGTITIPRRDPRPSLPPPQP